MNPSTDLDWLIVGGGIHGVHIAARLIGDAGVESSRLRIVDPGERLLERWRASTATTGMTHLRSPAVHHLDLNPHALMQYAGTRRTRKAGLFARPFNRPNLQFFNDHCDTVIARFDLDALHVRARVIACSVTDEAATIGLSNGMKLQTRNVVFAIGSGDRPRWPDWAPVGEARVHHAFSPGFDGWPTERESVAVIGGGISAAQVALRLAEEGHEVHLIARHPLREHQFDSDPGWLGPKRMAEFQNERDVGKRRAMITAARHKGSIPPRVRRAVHASIRRGRLHWQEGAVEGMDADDASLAVRLSTGAKLAVHRVLMATGFEGSRPGGELLDRLIDTASLPCASCGYPIVDAALRWHPRVYVSGPLAELELGPSARNISGARRAADRLVQVARSAPASMARVSGD